MQLVRWFDTQLTADCVEVCGDQISVGTYQLSDGKRHGRLYQMDASLVPKVTIDLEAGILDMKYHLERGHLAMALSNGHLWLDNSLHLVERERILLSLDWSGDQIACSDDGGQVHLWDAVTQTVLFSWKAHELEAWHTSFDSNGCLYSAGDDGTWALWDTRGGDLISRSSKHHTAGVCTVQGRGDAILTGSYDRQLLQWDRRNLRSPTASLYFGSGVWRMRWQEDRCLVAAMHDGFHVIQVSEMTKISHFPSASLAYGCAWLDGQHVLGCSFYDHTAYLLRI